MAEPSPTIEEPVKVPDPIVSEVVQTAETLSPAQKEALAREKVPSTGLAEAVKSGKHVRGNLGTDLGTNDTAAIVTAVANASAKPVTEPEPVKQQQQQEEERQPGALDDKKVGWTAFSSLPNPGDEKAMESLLAKVSGTPGALAEVFQGSRTTDGSEVLSKDLLAQYLKESYYGEWYHNAGVMLFAVFFTWLVTKLGGGLMACLVVGAFLGRTNDRGYQREIEKKELK